ncbi:MAG: VWA domain-containing protein [Planctomycetaceae bacterium]|nr:VWA domain-containing protein [Planctomycetaceae bacterium]
MVILAEITAVAGLLLMAGAEVLHWRRCRQLSRLAFGPTGRPNAWVAVTPFLRVVAVGALSWGLVTLLLLDPKIHSQIEIDPKKQKNLLLVVDVSPSMYLVDAGPEKNMERRVRASQVVGSILNRIPVREYRISLVAFYSGAKPILDQTTDFDIVQHMMEKLPIYQGFNAGKTDLFAGLTEASRLAKNWNPKSTTVIVLTDGMSVPSTGMPRMPASVREVLVIGVGDPVVGKFIDGHQSRQDIASLRQIANRLQGVYHDANIKHLPSSSLAGLIGSGNDRKWWELTRRELALIATAVGGSILGVLPVLLMLFGSSWRPGVKFGPASVT